MKFALITLSFFVSGSPDLQFDTVSKLYPAETCEVEKAKFVKGLTTPQVGQRDFTNVVAYCFPLSDEATDTLLRTFEQSKKNNNFAHVSHYQTTLIKLVGKNEPVVLPDLSLTSYDACLMHGRNTVARMKGIRTEAGLIEDVQFRCSAMSTKEANATLETLKGAK